jgi:hypothetical protein
VHRDALAIEAASGHLIVFRSENTGVDPRMALHHSARLEE